MIRSSKFEKAVAVAMSVIRHKFPVRTLFFQRISHDTCFSENPFSEAGAWVAPSLAPNKASKNALPFSHTVAPSALCLSLFPSMWFSITLYPTYSAMEKDV